MSLGCVPQIGIVIGGEADLAIAEEALNLLRGLRVPYAVTVLAVLDPDEVREYGRAIAQRGVEVIVAIGATMSHVAGRIAAYTTLPVIIVPTQAAGETSHSVEWGTLLAALETPPGVPLAVVGVNAAYNGVCLALQILGVKDHRVRARLAELRAAYAAQARERAEAVEAFSRGMQGNATEESVTSMRQDAGVPPRDAVVAITPRAQQDEEAPATAGAGARET